MYVLIISRQANITIESIKSDGNCKDRLFCIFNVPMEAVVK